VGTSLQLRLTPDGPFTRLFPSTPSAPSSPRRKSMAVHGDIQFSVPFLPGTTVSTPIAEEPPIDQDGGGSTTEDEGLGRVGKGWLGDLEG